MRAGRAARVKPEIVTLCQSEREFFVFFRVASNEDGQSICRGESSKRAASLIAGFDGCSRPAPSPPCSCDGRNRCSPCALLNGAHFLLQFLEVALGLSDTRLQFPFGGQMFPVLLEIVVHVAASGFGTVEEKRNFWKRFIVIVHKRDTVHAGLDRTEIGFEQLTIPCMVAILSRLRQVLSPCLNPALGFLVQGPERPESLQSGPFQRQMCFLVVVVIFDGGREGKPAMRWRCGESRRLLLTRSRCMFEGRAVWPTDEVPVALEIGQDMLLLIEKENIGGFPRQFTDQ